MRSIFSSMAALLLSLSALVAVAADRFAPQDFGQIRATPFAKPSAHVASLANALDPMEMDLGCVGDGRANDSPCIAAAIAAARPGAIISLASANWCLANIRIDKPITISGGGTGGTVINKCVANKPVFILASNDSALLKTKIEAAASGADTSAATIVIGTVMRVTVADNLIDQPCIGIDVSGNTIAITDNNLTSVQGGKNCGGIRIGAASKGAATVDATIRQNTIQGCNVTTSCRKDDPAEFGILLKDSGGTVIEYNDLLYTQYGIEILPGADQQVIWTFASGVFGDTYKQSGLYIDTLAPSALVAGFSAVNSWTSGYFAAPFGGGAGSGVEVHNRGGGIVDGFQFTAHRSYANGQNGFFIDAGVRNVAIDSSRICGNGQGKDGGSNGVAIASGARSVALRDTTIKNDCDHQSGGKQAYGLWFGGANTEILATGNNLTGNQKGGVGGAIPTEDSIVNNNLGQ